ncbi:MAG: hypothetical protein JHC33_08680 [Ignisphaera sp.]|nr:hypothetical protein [Ignisphaera sp.]
MINKSGIHPKGWRILVKPFELEETTSSGIVIAHGEGLERERMANTTAIVVEVGTECNTWCNAGDKVIFGKYSGLLYLGKDKVRYRIINDEDIVATLDQDVDVVDPYLAKNL